MTEQEKIDLKEWCEGIIDTAQRGYPIRVGDDEMHDVAKQVLELIADGERLDWLEKNRFIPNGICYHGSIEIVLNEGQTLRQAIDERRKA